MKVRELIEILRTCDPELAVATAANNREYMSAIDKGSHGSLRVVLLHTYGGDHVLIGNVSRKRLNAPNWYVKHALDGGAPIPKDHPRWDGKTWDFTDDFGAIEDEPGMERYRK